MKTGRFCDCPIDCQVNYTVEAQKSMKSIVRILHLPSVVQSEFNEVTRILFLRKENKTTILFNNLSPLVQRSIILENIRWTQAAYAVLCQPHRTDKSSTFVYALIWMKTAYPCGAADTEQRTLLASSRYSLQNGATLNQRRRNTVHNITVEPLMADGLFWRCFSYFSGPRQCYLLGSQWDSHKPVFIQNILNCVLKTNEDFMGLERHGGKWLMTAFSFWGGVTL